MRQRIRKVLFYLVLSAICSLAVVGMLAYLLVACGVHVGWLLALLSLPPGMALGVIMARSLSRQLLMSGADMHQQ